MRRSRFAPAAPRLPHVHRGTSLGLNDRRASWCVISRHQCLRSRCRGRTWRRVCRTEIRDDAARPSRRRSGIFSGRTAPRRRLPRTVGSEPSACSSAGFDFARTDLVGPVVWCSRLCGRIFIAAAGMDDRCDTVGRPVCSGLHRACVPHLLLSSLWCVSWYPAHPGAAAAWLRDSHARARFGRRGSVRDEVEPIAAVKSIWVRPARGGVAFTGWCGCAGTSGQARIARQARAGRNRPSQKAGVSPPDRTKPTAATDSRTTRKVIEMDGTCMQLRSERKRISDVCRLPSILSADVDGA